MLRKFTKEHSSVILAVGASLGVVTTAYLASVAGWKTANRLASEDPTISNKERARLVWKYYIPTAGTAAVTIVCIAGVKRIDGQKAMAAQAALALSQRAYERYRGEIVEEFGERKDKAVLARVAEKEVNENPPKSIIAGSGQVMCCELWTMRYFMSDMETLKRAVNELNAKLLRDDSVAMDEFYYILGLEYTHSSNHSGWESNKLLDLEFSSILHDGKPVLAFQYNYVKSL